MERYEKSCSQIRNPVASLVKVNFGNEYVVSCAYWFYLSFY